MPTYVYECRACGEQFELLRKIGRRNHNAACPACKSRRTERLLVAPFGVSFKGSGTYDSDQAASVRPKVKPVVTDGGG